MAHFIIKLEFNQKHLIDDEKIHQLTNFAAKYIAVDKICNCRQTGNCDR